MYKIVFYVPVNAAEAVKQAVFSAGGGRIGNYDRCCWQSLGKGQFRALEGATPFIGEEGQTEYVDELRVELVCEDEYVKVAVRALVQAHPYETPAYDVWKLAQLD